MQVFNCMLAYNLVFVSYNVCILCICLINWGDVNILTFAESAKVSIHANYKKLNLIR